MQVPLCRHIHINGTTCRAVALKGQSFCYHHNRLLQGHGVYRYKVGARSHRLDNTALIDLPLLEDRLSIQFALSKVVNALATDCIDAKKARTLFYGLQLASSNAKGLETVQLQPADYVREVYHLASEPGDASPDIAPPGRTCDLPDALPATDNAKTAPTTPPQPQQSVILSEGRIATAVEGPAVVFVCHPERSAAGARSKDLQSSSFVILSEAPQARGRRTPAFVFCHHCAQFGQRTPDIGQHRTANACSRFPGP